jgi:glycerate 2-kinase
MVHFNPNQFSTHSLRASLHEARVERILAAALNAVDPAVAVRNHLRREKDCLIAGGHRYDLKDFRQVFVIGFGKASVPMAQAALEILGKTITQGILITKSIHSAFPFPNSQFVILKGSHPVPDQTCMDGAQQIVDLLSTTTEKDLVLCLISGGGSALLTLPGPGIFLDDLQSLTQTLLACGATIDEINCLRKHLSQIKGGQLARLAAPAQVLTMILSDVVGDPLDVIASGPTVPDPTTFSEALAILRKYNLTDQIPTPILDHLKRGANDIIPETPKPGDPIFEQVHNVIVGSNLLAAQAATIQAKNEGFNTHLLTTSLQGEARIAGRMLAGIGKQVITSGEPIPRPACIVAGGETTVTLLSPSPLVGKGVRGEGDRGGRNQELALAAVTELVDLNGVMLVTLATDGEDGPTDAAGAVVTSETLQRARSLGFDPDDFLARNDSYNFFDPLGDLLKIGSTQTNVNDLTLLFVFLHL